MQSEEGSQESEDPDRSIEELIASLRQRSKFQRTNIPEHAGEIRAEDGTIFWCIRITKQDDLLVHAIRRLFRKSFSKEERDPFRELKDIVADKNFQTYALVDLKRNLIGAVCAGFFEVKNRIDRTKELIVFIDNIAVDPAWKRRGFAQELYLTVCESAQRQGRMRGLSIRAILGEAKSEVEEFWNKLGWRQIYYCTGRNYYAAVPFQEVSFDKFKASVPQWDFEGMFEPLSGTFALSVVEVLYFQPPLLWDFAKGIPREGCVPAKTHLMAWVADPAWRPLDISELIMMIEQIYFNNFLPSRTCFTNECAYRRCRGELLRLLQKTQNVLSSSILPALLLLSKEERENIGFESPVNWRGFFLSRPFIISARRPRACPWLSGSPIGRRRRPEGDYIDPKIL